VLNPQSGLTYTFGTSSGFVTLTIGSTATFSTWTSATGGSWNTAGNWSSGIPNAANAAASFLGALTAPGTVTLDGIKTVGNVQFNNAQSYTIAQGTGGTLTLNAGTGAAQITSLNGSHIVSAPVSLDSNTAVDVTSAADTLSITGNITGSRTLTKNAAGVLRLSGTNTHSGTILNGGILEIASNGALGSGSLTFNSSATLRAGAAGLAPSNPIVIGNNATAILDTGTNALQSAGLISSIDATGGLTKVGTGTLTLGNANTYSGVTTINGGVLAASALADGGVASSIGQSSNAAANVVIDGGTLRYTGAAANTDRLFTIGSNGATLDAMGTGPIGFTNTDSLAFSGTNTASSLTLTGTNTDANTLTAVIGNNGSGITSLNKTGTGTWLLGGTNMFTGDTTISGGTLALGNPLALQRSTLNYNNQGGTLGFDLLGAATLGGLSGSQNLELENTFDGSVVLTVGANNGSTTYGGVLSGFGSLTKVGSGVLSLTGKSTYSGPTTIAAGGGVLKVLTTDALSPSTAVTVNNPGGLQLGDGTTLSSNITAAVGANEFLDVPDAGATATLGGTLGVAGGGNQFRLGITGVSATLNVTGGISTLNAASIVFLTRGNIVFSGERRNQLGCRDHLWAIRTGA
jgi:fibronectin-binding autotransporter adhesin